MTDNLLTFVGNVVAEPEHKLVGEGIALTRLRVASTHRRFDRAAGEWRDGGTTYLAVTCWRRLAENVAGCVHKGDPVVVCGRLVGRSYEADGRSRYVHELEATSVGHDLARACTVVHRGEPAGSPAADPTTDGPPVGGAPAEDPTAGQADVADRSAA